MALFWMFSLLKRTLLFDGALFGRCAEAKGDQYFGGPRCSYCSNWKPHCNDPRKQRRVPKYVEVAESPSNQRIHFAPNLYTERNRKRRIPGSVQAGVTGYKALFPFFGSVTGVRVAILRRVFARGQVHLRQNRPFRLSKQFSQRFKKKKGRNHGGEGTRKQDTLHRSRSDNLAGRAAGRPGGVDAAGHCRNCNQYGRTQ